VGTCEAAFIVLVVEYATLVVEDAAYFGATRSNGGPRRLDVGDDEVEPLRGTWVRGREATAKNDGTWRTRGSDLNDPKAALARYVGIQPPAETCIETLCPVDVGHRNNDNFELHVDFV
jgi:hypothetical protein